MVWPPEVSEIADAVRDAMLVLDRTWSLSSANSAYFELFGGSAARSIGSAPVDRCGNEWLTEALKAELALVASGGKLDDFEMRGFFGYPDERVLSISGRTTVRSKAEAQVLLVCSDVTARRVVETENRVRAAMLVRQNRDLERSNASLDQFAQIASHDLKEPVRKIMTYAGLLRRSAAPKLDADELQLLDRVMAAANRAQLLIADVLALARVTTVRPEYKRIDLGQVVRDACADMELLIAQRGAVVEVGPMPIIEGDSSLLRQLFQNLISNAVKFTDAGVVPRVVVSAAATNAGTVAVTVSDNGIGFAAEHSAQIFDPFRRLHGRGTFEGSGIGLSICARVVEHHGGTITTRSAPGEGSAFVITLPLTQSLPGVQS